MKKMLIVIGTVLILSIVFSGCLEKYKFEGTGTIVFIDIEGGFYGIVSDEFYYGTKTFDPINLPSEFMEDGLRVKFKAILWYDYGFHMWGRPVVILEIERLDSF